tara:strand:- start:86 stop:397 length:312 start_codon:yes stop_codon:yes gene_type:complete
VIKKIKKKMKEVTEKVLKRKYDNIVQNKSSDNTLQIHVTIIDMWKKLQQQDTFNMYLINIICELTKRVQELEKKNEESQININDLLNDEKNLDEIIKKLEIFF